MAMDTVYDIGFTVGTGVMREDLTDEIFNVSPTETPMFSGFGATKARSTTHEWVEDAGPTAADNAKKDGETFSYTSLSSFRRLSNWTQIISRTVQVSNSAIAADIAGIKDLYIYHLEKQMRGCALDAEYAIVNGTGASGATGTARRMIGVIKRISADNYASANVITLTATAYLSASQNVLNTLLTTIWTNGAAPTSWSLYCSAFQKVQISKFSGTSLRLEASALEYKVVDRVDIYDGPIGSIRVVPDRFTPPSTVIALDNSTWKKAMYRPFTHLRTAIVADAVNGAVVGELTLEARAPKLSGYISGLATA